MGLFGLSVPEKITMANTSPDFLWSMIRNNSCFLLKNNGKQFTREPNNLRNVNSYRYNGLVHKKTVGVIPGKNAKGVTFITKKKKSTQMSKNSYNRVDLKKNSRATLKSISNMMGQGRYRKDLKMAALRRASAIIRSQRPVAVKKTGRKQAKAAK